MSETIETNDTNNEIKTDGNDNLDEVKEIVKRGRGRPKKESQPENEQPKPKKSKRFRKSESDEPKIKRPKGRPRIENPCKAGCPKGGRDYFKAYYKSHNAGIIINCPNCNAFTENVNIKNHMRSKMCAKYSQFAKCQIIENTEN